MKKFLSFFIVICVLILSSCGEEDSANLAKGKFSKYGNGKHEVVLLLAEEMYLDGYTINLNTIVDGDDRSYSEQGNNGYMFKDGKIFFSTSSQYWESFQLKFKFSIYECNLTGNNLKKLFEKDGYVTHPWAYAADDIFYIEYNTRTAFHADSRKVDSYNIVTGEYKNEASGKDSDIRDYKKEEPKSKYACEVIGEEEERYFEIKDVETGEVKIFDNACLRETQYIEDMESFDYGPMRADVSNNHILLTYRIIAGGIWDAPHLVFEYDFETETIEYKLFAVPYDSMWIKINYIGLK